MAKWKKPARPSNTFADALKITGLKASNYTHYVEFDGLIIQAGRFENNMIKGEFFLNNQGLIRLYG